MRFSCEVQGPMVDHNGKKYIHLLIPDDVKQIIHHVYARHPLEGEWRDDPLDGNVLAVKVPFRYRRVMCTFEGVPVQSLRKGDEVDVDILFMGVWNYERHCGYSWKLSYIKSRAESIV